MVGIGSKRPNTLTEQKSNVAIKKSDVKKQSISEAAAASTTDWVVVLDNTTNVDTQDEAHRQNTDCLTAIGVKEAITVEIMVIVGSHITNPILRTTDGSDFITVDQYALHQLFSAVKNGSERLSATAIRQMMVYVMAKSLDWQESAVTNLEELSTATAKAATYGVKLRNDMKGLIVTANVAYAAHQTWGSEIAEAQRKIKAKYMYNKVHDVDSIIMMMTYLASADE